MTGIKHMKCLNYISAHTYTHTFFSLDCFRWMPFPKIDWAHFRLLQLLLCFVCGVGNKRNTNQFNLIIQIVSDPIEEDIVSVIILCT